jgi:magnesium chelatase family protein
MLARRLPGILPAMTPEESLEVTKLHSIAGLLEPGNGLARKRPFRTPHHSISAAGLVGGGPGLPRPGEVALANHGVLFMDELPLFRRDVIESLRAPLEDGIVRVVRSGGAVAFRCRFSLVAAMNPCPCGYLEDPSRPCRCTGHQLASYRARLSGPVLDRFDLQLGMTRVTGDDLVTGGSGEPSAIVRARVEAARAIQRERFGHPHATNASVRKRTLFEKGDFSRDAFRCVRSRVDAGIVTGRGFERVLRVARTIADVEGGGAVEERHVGKALMYRSDTVVGGVAA